MTVVKICGTTSLEDALLAAEAGANLLGFVLYPPSPRYVAPEQAARIVDALHRAVPHPPHCVGVFVNVCAAEVENFLTNSFFDYAQLHGDEDESWLSALGGQAFKAIRPSNPAQALDHSARLALPHSAPGPHLLLDAYTPHVYGGTGQQADWQSAAAVARNVDHLLLAGGLTPDNVAAAIQTVRPWGVDVASGVEERPGVKNPQRLRAFLDAVHRC